MSARRQAVRRAHRRDAEPRETLTSDLIEESRTAFALIEEFVDAVQAKDKAPVESTMRVERVLGGMKRLLRKRPL